MYFKIIFTTYLKNFLLICLSLVMFFVFMDFMINKGKLPDSTNLQMLYISYNAVGAAISIYPLSLLLALLVTTINLIKRNEMIALLSLGYSLKKLLFPVTIVALLVTLFFIGVQSLSSSSFRDKATSIMEGKYFSNLNKNLFFKFNNNVIFIKELDLIRKTAQNMKIFVLDGEKVSKIYEIKYAIFKNNSWYSDKIIEHNLYKNAVVDKEVKINLLKGFKPDILNKLETKSGMTLKIAFQALYLLKKENVDINFIKTYIYNALIPPLSFILLIMIIFLKSPIHARISNLSLYISISLFVAVILWASFLLIRKMAVSGIISPDLSFLPPFFILFVVFTYLFKKT